MNKIDRLQYIKNLIRKSHQVEVSTLSSLLQVSDVTIRNDLEELEKEGFLQRFHGGAILEEHIHDNDAFHLQQSSFSNEAKRALAITASNLLDEKEWVFLGPGTTPNYIAMELCKLRNINVCTNNFFAAATLMSAPDIRINFAGGWIDRIGQYCSPDFSNLTLTPIFFDWAFFSVDAVDLNSGYTLSDTTVKDIIYTIKSHTNHLVMAIDSSKIGQRSSIKVGDLDFADTVIANSDLPQEYIDYYKEHNINLYM